MKSKHNRVRRDNNALARLSRKAWRVRPDLFPSSEPFYDFILRNLSIIQNDLPVSELFSALFNVGLGSYIVRKVVGGI